MRVSRVILILSLMWVCALPAFARERASYDSDDMYATHDRKVIEQQRIIEYKAAEREAQWRMEQWAEALGMDIDEMAREGEAFDTPYGKRLRAISASEYQLPDSYYEYQYQEVLQELSNYDPALYTASIDYRGNLSIEPKFMSSIYGVWGDPFYYPPYFYSSYYYSPYFYYRPYYYPPYHYSFYYPSRYYPPYYRPPYHHARPRPRSIVRHTPPHRAPSSQGGGPSYYPQKKRNANGSTVGSSSNRGSNNRGTSSSTTNRPSAPSSYRSSSSSSSRTPSSSSSSSGSSMRTNSIGR